MTHIPEGIREAAWKAFEEGENDHGARVHHIEQALLAERNRQKASITVSINTDGVDQAIAERWQPIETAPTGEALLLYFPKTYGRRAHSGFIKVERIPTLCSRKPSHWMPLPPPPSIHESEGEGA